VNRKVFKQQDTFEHLNKTDMCNRRRTGRTHIAMPAGRGAALRESEDAPAPCCAVSKSLN
jgi:hypothetical protein